MRKILLFSIIGIILTSSFGFALAKEESPEDILFIGKITKIGQDSIKFKTEDGEEYSALIDRLTHLTDKSYDEIIFEKFKKGQNIRVWGVLATDDFHIYSSFIRNLSLK